MGKLYFSSILQAVSLHRHVPSTCERWQEEKKQQHKKRPAEYPATAHPLTRVCLEMTHGWAPSFHPVLSAAPSRRRNNKPQSSSLQSAGAVQIPRPGAGCLRRLPRSLRRGTLRRSVSHVQSRRGQRQPQSAHSHLNMETGIFGVYVRPFLWPHEPDADMPQSAVFPLLELWFLHTSNVNTSCRMKEWKKSDSGIKACEVATRLSK